MKILNMGAGKRRLGKEGEVTLDIEPPADILWDLNRHPLPFEDEEFDEICANHVLEHLSRQGDYKFFFEEWNEYYRILKPEGIFQGIVPVWNDIWAWSDPGHTRVIPAAMFTFLCQNEYKKQIGKTGMTDYRNIYKGNFKIITTGQTLDANLIFVLKKI